MGDDINRIELPDYGREAPYGGSTFAWVWFFLRPHRWPLAFWYTLSILRRGVFSSHSFFLGVAIGMVESGAAKENPDALISWFVMYAVIHVIAYFGIAIIIPAGGLMSMISKQVSLFGFRHYLALPESWHEEKASGEKLQRLVTARKAVYDLMENAFWHVTQIPGFLGVIFISMTALGAPYYYILLYVGFIVSFLMLGFRTGHWLNARFAENNRTLEKVIGGVYEFVVSTSTVRFFNLKQFVSRKGGALEWDNHQTQKGIYRTVVKRWVTLDFLALFWLIGIIALATYEAINGTLSIAAYTTILFFNIAVWTQLEDLTVIYKQVIEQWEGFKRLTEILNQRPSIVDAEGAEALDVSSASISFDSVTFRYNEARSVINALNLQVKAGEKVGMLGPSGAGKSTIVKLLLRFYDLEKGAVTIGGQNIKGVTLESLQGAVAVIPQDVTLFNHPLIENIRYGRLDASDAEVMEAARRANAHEFILDLPDGYQTLVGERGVKLSGGQRQRIAIARAILKDAPILILDEATSALDSESEQLIQASLAELMDGKTVIAIAHRLSTIASLDRLVVMQDGAIVEQGSHDELIEANGLYAQLWGMQSGGFLTE